MKPQVTEPIISSKSYSAGFTLMELMIVVAIIAILSAIAIPSYRRYIVLNSERDVQTKMLQLQIQLNRWRASTLTYKGFMPPVVASDNTVTYGYDANNQTIYVPQGSNASNYRYQIVLVDGAATTKSLAPAVSTTIDNVTGRTWKMLATPNPTGSVSSARRMMLGSEGVQCVIANGVTDITIASTDCGIGQEQW